MTDAVRPTRNGDGLLRDALSRRGFIKGSAIGAAEVAAAAVAAYAPVGGAPWTYSPWTPTPDASGNSSTPMPTVGSSATPPGVTANPGIECDNPGVWAFHCHILPHAEGHQGIFGMVNALIVQA